MAALAVFALALTLRLAFLGQIESLPFLSQPVVDGQFLDAWAREIAGGNWWGDEVFYQAPGYPYFLAGIYSLFGDSLWRAHQIQMLMGSLSCVVMYFAASCFFDRRVGLVAGVILAVYPPALFFDSLIQKASLGLLLTCVFLWLVARFQERPSIQRACACGASAAILGLTRQHGLILLVAITIWIAFRYSDLPRSLRLRWVAAFVLSATLILSGVASRNYSVGETWALTSSNFGANFYIGNHSGAVGLYSPLVSGRQSPEFESLDAMLLAEAATGRELTAGEVSRYWLVEGLSFILEQPAEWLAQLWVKAMLTVNVLEVPDSQDMHSYVEASPLLAGLMSIMHFGILLPLATAGMLMAWSRGRDVWIHYCLPLAFGLSVIIFFVFARYRFPLVPILLPIAAFGLVELLRRAWARDLQSLIAPASVIAITLAICNYRVLDEDSLHSASFANMGVISMWDGDLERAELYLERAAEYDAESSEVLFQWALLRYQQRRLEDAKVYLHRIIERKQDDYRPHLLIARILEQQGRNLKARRHRQAAARLNPEGAGRKSGPWRMSVAQESD